MRRLFVFSGIRMLTAGCLLGGMASALAASSSTRESFWINGEVTPAGVCRCECPVTSTPPKADGLTDKEAKALLAEFIRSQKAVIAGVEHRHRLELLELKNTQNARRRSQTRKEEESRHEFNKTKPGAEEKKMYAEDLKSRWEVFNQVLVDETAQKKSQQKVELDGIRGGQEKKLAAFKEYLSRKERPPLELWPRSGQ